MPSKFNFKKIVTLKKLQKKKKINKLTAGKQQNNVFKLFK